MIPQVKVGIVIGRDDATKRDSAVQSGSKMNIVKDSIYANTPEQPLRPHSNPFQIQKASELGSGIIQQQKYHIRNSYGGQIGGHNSGGDGNFNQNQRPFEASSNLFVDKEYVSDVISGDTIKRHQSEVQFKTIDPVAPGDRNLIIQVTKDLVAITEYHWSFGACVRIPPWPPDKVSQLDLTSLSTSDTQL